MTMKGGNAFTASMMSPLPTSTVSLPSEYRMGYDDFMASFMIFFNEMYELKTIVAFLLRKYL